MSQILKASPFSDDVLSLSMARIDWILQMYQKDHPKEFSFVAAHREGDLSPEENNVAWADRLSGAALKRFLGRWTPRLPDEYRDAGERA